MKKSEIKAAPSDELILCLVRLSRRSIVTKTNQQQAGWICEELAARGIISEKEAMYERWNRIYTGTSW